MFYTAYPTINPCTLTCCILNFICTHWGKALVCESSKKAHLMIGRWSDCVKKEVPWNPSVTISHNQIIISGARKNRLAPTSFVPNASWENASLCEMHPRAKCISQLGASILLTAAFLGFSQNSKANAREQLTPGRTHYLTMYVYTHVSTHVHTRTQMYTHTSTRMYTHITPAAVKSLASLQ